MISSKTRSFNKKAVQIGQPVIIPLRGGYAVFPPAARARKDMPIRIMKGIGAAGIFFRTGKIFAIVIQHLKRSG